MILVNLFKVKGVTAMFCGLMHGKPESAATGIDVSCRTDVWKVRTEGNSGGRAGCGQDEPAAPRFAPVTDGEHNGPPYFKSRRVPGPNPVRKFALSRAPFSLGEFHIGSDGSGSVRHALPASLQTGAGRQGPRARSEAVLNTNAFQFGKQAT
jgi:hypothetical protein